MDTINGCNMTEGKMPNYEIGRKKKTLKALTQNKLHWNLCLSDYQIYIHDSSYTV